MLLNVLGQSSSTHRSGLANAFGALIDTLSGNGTLTRANQLDLQIALEGALGQDVVGFAQIGGNGIAVQLAGQDEALALTDLAAALGLDADIVGTIETNLEVMENLETLLDDLLAALGELGTALQSGEGPSTELIGRLDGLVDSFASALGVDLSTAPAQAGQLTDSLAEGASLAERLPDALARLAALFQDDGGTSGQADPLDALARKLDTFAAALRDAQPELGARLNALLDALGSERSADLNAQLSDLVKRLMTSARSEQAGSAPAATDDQRAATAQATGQALTVDQQDDGLHDKRLGLLASGRANTAAVPPPTASPSDGGTSLDDPITQLALQTGTRIDVTPGAKPVSVGYQTSQQQINLPQIAFEMVRQVNQGNSQFQIRLDPPELGRIDVRMEIDQAGNINARLMVEKSETLDLMQRDQRALERALAQAGLDSGKTTLEFSLRQNPFANQGQGGKSNDQFLPGADTEESEAASAPTVTLYRGNISATGLNLVV